jgi:poly [ADP-ribose] polymerase
LLTEKIKFYQVQTSLEVKSNGNGQNVETKNSKENTADPPPQPAMDERVVKLMQTLCDLKTMESEARRLDYDFKRIPLGKISKEQIKAGYEALSRIEQHIRDNKFDRNFTEAVNE